MGWSKKKKIIIYGIVALVVCGSVGGGLFYHFALKSVPIVTIDEESPQRVVDNGEIDGFDGKVIILSTFRPSDVTKFTYYLSMIGTEYPIDAAPPIDLHFRDVYTTDNILTTTKSTFVVANVQSLTFPHRLRSGYNPDIYNGGIFIDANEAIIGNVGFSGPVPPPVPPPAPSSQPSVPPSVAPSVTSQPSVTSKPSVSPSISSAPSPSSPGPSAKPTTIPSVATTSSMPSGVQSSHPSVFVPPPGIVSLSTQLSGSGSYTIKGTITLEIVLRLVNGEIVETPSFMFQNIESPSAPDAFLYLSKDTGKDVNGAITISIDGASNGRLARNGNFVQDLDEEINLEDYKNGSFVVWCKRFGVYLGGGEITALLS
mmetsp:Transcript_24276/g.28596  ORF Transcript_24276/g.28596 Transcript_24276/m.28596 type:complete len:370 (+) Transcript_24276:137-1246(+)|eukprot:CAMPEP_0198251748 /NCGR_PEP_ID=MMETSP1447-20131203/2484_1 /TAXON_ID=420782 /ORGANISM="Chaetoceros dichaeta, Strain CCMP1751" /LENGTH=369 /DNA_ID=CAMNT_0043936841 /DNA_START=100 /DNA_END=1209 /DNA_ORIENTATION=+